MAKEQDKLFKLTPLVFINALMKILGLQPGIDSIEFPEVFSLTGERGIMDLPVLTKMGYYIIFEFHSQPLSEDLLLRNFQYLANLRRRVKLPVEMYIISTNRLKDDVKEVNILPDWKFKPHFMFLIDYDGDEILSTMKDKVKSNLELTFDDAYWLSVLPFIKHEKNDVDFIKELSEFINSIEIKSELKYVIELSQIWSVGALVDDIDIKNDLIGEIKMMNNAIIEYERRIIDEAVDEAVTIALDEAFNNYSLNMARNMRDENYSRDEILKLTGVDILTI